MRHIERHAPGTFTWIELGTTDQSAAKHFYGALFGWESQDHPMGPDAVYTTFQLDARNAAGCFALKPSDTVPPYWGLYIGAEDADASAARATALGGTIIEGPFDISTLGRAAVIKDPTGAVFSLWQPKTHSGTGIAGVNGTLCWADLNTPGRRAARMFYEQLFGWEFEPGKDKTDDDYLHIKAGAEFIGGMLPESMLNPHAPPHWLAYFQVADVDASTAKAKELGARINLEPTSIGDALRLSVISDPQGAVFALFASH